MYQLFISYAHSDLEKVQLILEELKNHRNLSPVVIAFNDEPLTPLTEKVKNGILESVIIIPIITKNSINQQWLNQEIGFATAHDKKFYPVIEYSVLHELKGFIHKELDLPYIYEATTNLGQEHKNFIASFRKLLRRIEVDYPVASLKKAETQREKVPFEKVKEKLKKKSEELKMKAYLQSAEGRLEAKNEIDNLFKIAMEKFNELRSYTDRLVLFKSDMLNVNFRMEHVEIHIWPVNYDSEATLKTSFVIKNNLGNLASIDERQYSYNIEGNTKGWVYFEDPYKNIITSEAIVDRAFEWLFNQL